MCSNDSLFVFFGPRSLRLCSSAWNGGSHLQNPRSRPGKIPRIHRNTDDWAIVPGSHSDRINRRMTESTRHPSTASSRRITHSTIKLEIE